ncbi:LEA type 2 family protein [candidate division KSB1 bacterium]|nr:LEA type 2 family protein [candidate division KSB1 bacterium]
MKKQWIALLAGLGLFFSCASLETLIQKPGVKIESVQIAGFSFQELTLDFGLLISNPNTFGVSLDGFTYDFILQEQSFLKGDKREPLQVAAQGTSTLHIPVTLAFDQIANLVKNTQSLDSLNYQIRGSILPGGLLAGTQIPFSKSGSFPNVRLPRASLQNLNVKKLSLSGVDLELALNLDNPNAFGFDIGQFAYRISLAGSNVAQGQTDQLASVPGKNSGTVRLPLSLSFTDLGTSLMSALSGKKIRVGIEGRSEFKTPFGPVDFPFQLDDTVNIFR